MTGCKLLICCLSVKDSFGVAKQTACTLNNMVRLYKSKIESCLQNIKILFTKSLKQINRCINITQGKVSPHHLCHALATNQKFPICEDDACGTEYDTLRNSAPDLLLLDALNLQCSRLSLDLRKQIIKSTLASDEKTCFSI